MRILIIMTTAMLAAVFSPDISGETVTKTLQAGVGGYTGVTDAELRDPVQGDIGASWWTVQSALGIQAN